MNETDAVLVVEAAGSPYAIPFNAVAGIRGCELLASGEPPASLDFRGVAVPVYDLVAALAGDAGRCPPQAVVVLDLPDRLAGVTVDSVRDVRIARRRRGASMPPAAAERPAIDWIAALPEGETPVLDLAAWLSDAAPADADGAHSTMPT